MGSVAVSGSWSNTRREMSRRSNSQFHKFRITGLDGKQPSDAVYFEHITCRSNQQHVRFVPHQGRLQVSNRSSHVRLCRVAAICMYLTASPNSDHFRGYGVPRRNSYTFLLSMTVTSQIALSSKITSTGSTVSLKQWNCMLLQ